MDLIETYRVEATIGQRGPRSKGREGERMTSIPEWGGGSRLPRICALNLKYGGSMCVKSKKMA